ncbi:hypothetical protein CRP01_02395 [Flavilitoribacter nigricans DSM 23189 = NBRC 102662]|uniref:Uncharacterized protein n=2 Tax=Flavilitoribacter TaxID=2762562 RepID=A0A2D0NI77_FLAN2|nr:hypothetical protein CRP01_02395 [Flavilitoribacter nigricans DSM 23189 = NBRC 102662]
MSIAYCKPKTNNHLIMRIILYLAAFLSLISCGENTTAASREEPTPTQDTPTPNEEPTAAMPNELNDIEDIRTTFAFITSEIDNGQLDSTAFKYDCHGETGGTVTYFSHRGQLRMIRHASYAYSHHSAIDRYYILDDQPFFVFYDQESWIFDPDSDEEGATKSDITEKRFYLIDNEPVQCLEKKFTTRSSVDDGPNSQNTANREVACSGLEDLQKTYDLLLQHRGQREELQCFLE